MWDESGAPAPGTSEEPITERTGDRGGDQRGTWVSRLVLASPYDTA